MKRILSFLVLTGLLLTGPASAEWVDNGLLKMKINAVEEVTKMEDLGKLRRYGNKEKRAKILGKIADGVKIGDYKIVLVDVSIKNIDKGHRVVGYDTYSGLGTWSHFAGLLYLRSSDGAEVNSSNALAFDSEPYHNHQGKYAGSELTYYLGDGLAMSAKIAPGAMVTGKVAFVVPDWFEPAKLFTYGDKNNKGNWSYGPQQLVMNVQ